MGSEADLDVVRRMIELQFKLMNDDPEVLYRMPTSVQPDGRREYHVRRNSQDNRQNAAMFQLTGGIEVMEEAWCYYEARKDAAWLRANIGNLEHAAGWILSNTDHLPHGRNNQIGPFQLQPVARPWDLQMTAALAPSSPCIPFEQFFSGCISRR